MRRLCTVVLALLAVGAPGVAMADGRPLATYASPVGSSPVDPARLPYTRTTSPFAEPPLPLRPQVLWIRIDPTDLPTGDNALQFRVAASNRTIFMPQPDGSYKSYRPVESFFALPHVSKPIFASMTMTSGRLPNIEPLTDAQLDERREVSWSQFFIGFFLAIGLFNVLIYAVLRDPPFLWYAGIMGSMIGIELVSTPLAAPYVGAFGPAASPLLRIFSLSAYFVFIVFFSRSFLRLRRQFPILDIANFVILAINLLALCAESLLGAYWTFAWWFDDVLLAAMLASLIVCGVTVYRRGDTTARYYVIAFLGAALGLVINDAADRLDLHAQWITYMFQIGVAWEAIFLALALADRTHRIAVENEKLGIAKIQAEILASQDGLTGVANRRAFDLAFDNAWRSAALLHEMLAVIILDVDDFKHYNDSHGHLLGDDVLRKIAHACEDCTRQGLDTFARYGGEEFAAVLPKAGYHEAAGVAERMRLSVQALNIPHQNGTPVTVSIGIAIMDGTTVVPAQSLLNKADEALYEAKAQGKNRSIVTSG